MEIHVREGNQVVEVWLTNVEKRNQELRERLKPLYRECKAKNYLVAVFESGEHDLCDATSELLCYNRRRIAQLEVKRERQADIRTET